MATFSSVSGVSSSPKKFSSGLLGLLLPLAHLWGFRCPSLRCFLGFESRKAPCLGVSQALQLASDLPRDALPHCGLGLCPVGEPGLWSAAPRAVLQGRVLADNTSVREAVLVDVCPSCRHERRPAPWHVLGARACQEHSRDNWIVSESGGVCSLGVDGVSKLT